MSKKLYIDCETRSATKIGAGLPNYMADKHFKVLIVSWAVDEEPPRLWIAKSEPCPARLKALVQDDTVTLVAHNSTFDRRAFNVSNLFGCYLPAERFLDTMVQALEHGLSASLDSLSRLFGLGDDVGKIKDGKRLINIFCCPDRSHLKKAGKVRFFNEKTNPEDWDAFKKYAAQDITAMREVHKRLPTINYPRMEHRLWCLDQEINGRGIPVDLDMAESAVREASIERARLNSITDKKSGGAVKAATQRDKLLQHLISAHGVNLPDLQSATLERRLGDADLPAAARSLIELRLQSSQNASAKYRRVIEQAFSGRLCNTMQFCGASRTGRDAGRVFQPQNLKRPTVWSDLEGAELAEAIEDDVRAIKEGTVSLIHDMRTMEVLGSCVRSVIAAPEGKRLVQADLSNIEGRALVWLSGEDWKLKFFRDFDAGKIKFDNYVAAYARSMNIRMADVTKYQRAIGKVMELSMGYGGGVGAFIGYVNIYNLDLDELASAVFETGDKARLKDCRGKHEWAVENGYDAGLNETQYAACEYLKQLWREAHPRTVKMWKDLEEAFTMATVNEGETFKAGHLAFKRKKHWLYARLPSGRCLVFLKPRIGDGGELSYLQWDKYLKRYVRTPTYSGKLAENVSSGTARDVLFHRMPDVESAGYNIVMRVHDELVCEAEDRDDFNSDHLCEIMTRPFDWSNGLPLAAEGSVMYRYRKE